MEISKAELEALGFIYSTPEEGWQEAEKGCILLSSPYDTNHWFIDIEFDHDYSKRSSALTLEAIVILDSILNKS